MNLKGMFFLLIGSLCAMAVSGAEPAKRIMLNEDASHFFMSRTSDEMTLESLNAFVDQYAETQLTDLFLNLAESRANRSNPVREAIWEPNCDGVEPTHIWPVNCKLLEERGLDPYKIWIDRCREKNIKAWLSFRMNDVHDANDVASYMHSSFWVNHPEFWRVPNESDGVWINRAFNFKHPEVRRHVTDYIDYLFEYYDCDGLELDWMRFGWHLTPDHSEEEGGYITEIVEHAKQKADEWGKKRGHKIDLSVRVPADPDAARILGMDAVAWAKSGLVDLIVPCPFWTTCDFDIPMEVWKERLANTNVLLVPGLECNVRPNPGAGPVPCTLAQMYGFAASEIVRGADGVYFFNWMDRNNTPVPEADFMQSLKSGFSDAEFLQKVPRELTLTFRDTVPPGFSSGAQLPKPVTEPVTLRIPSGPKPVTGTNGIAVALSPRSGEGTTEFAVTLNDVESESQTELQGTAKAFPTEGRSLFFTFPISAFRDGDNEVVITPKNGGDEQIIFVSAQMNQ